MNLNTHVKIILLETTSPANIGSTLRAMKTMAFTDLILVNPKNFPNKEVSTLASNAKDLIKNIKVVQNLDQALDDIDFVVATSSRQRKVPWPSEDLHIASPKIVHLSSHKSVGILFGREDRGLTNKELQKSNLHIQIPANENYPVLNLAMSVQVVCYQLYLDNHLNKPFKKSDIWDIPKAKSQHVQNLINHFIEVAEQLEVYNKGNPRQIGARIKRMFTRIGLDEMEVNFLRGFLAEIEKKLS